MEVSGYLVVPAVFKTDVAESSGQAGSIPVRLRDSHRESTYRTAGRTTLDAATCGAAPMLSRSPGPRSLRSSFGWLAPGPWPLGLCAPDELAKNGRDTGARSCPRQFALYM